jgi:ribosomal protein L11 methyltransferase
MQAFVIVVPAADAELASDRLFGLGVAAVEERSSNLGGHVELWTEVGDSLEAVHAAVTTLDVSWTWRTVELDESVTDSWREHAAPITAAPGVVIVPAWLAGTVETGGMSPILIDPGAAFGMGDHPTTQLTLRALLAELAARPVPASVLDVGCGSGVLAIAAAQRGAGPVVGIDIAAAAVEATEANARANGVADVVNAGSTPLAEVTGEFDIVLANVLAPALVDMSADLRRVVAAGGVLVVSGILVDRHTHVLEALAPLVPMVTSTQDGWAAVTLRHSADLGERFSRR